MIAAERVIKEWAASQRADCESEAEHISENDGMPRNRLGIVAPACSQSASDC
jgi:hypothetical protein